MKYLKYYLLIGVFFSINTIYAQEGEGGSIGFDPAEMNDFNVIPPSPNQSSLNILLSSNPNIYTGSLSHSLPLGGISTPQIQVPIQISGSSSGVRAEDVASWVGIGWNLIAGGSINRIVRGSPDELIINSDKKGYYHNYSCFVEDGSIDLNTIFSCDTSGEPEPLTFGDVPITVLDSISNGILDLEPDLYSFNFPGGSGKFLLKRTGNSTEIVPITESDIKIIQHPFQDLSNLPNPEIAYIWKIQDSRGITYTFNQAEFTRNTNYSNDTDPSYSTYRFQSAWVLSKIEINGENILFSYVDELNIYDANNSYSRDFKLTGSGSPNPVLSENVSEREIESKRLNAIYNGIGDSIVFNANLGRLDLNGSKQLDEIIFYNNSEIIKRYTLKYTYFGSNDKLGLTDINEVNEDSTKFLPAYQIEYYNPNLVISGNSYQIDYWGFPNGKTNSGIFPEYVDPLYHVNTNSNVNRNPVFNYAVAGSVKKITYPTGGNKEFEYELHDYYGIDKFNVLLEMANAVGGTLSTPIISYSNEFIITESTYCTITEDIYPESEDSYTEFQKWNDANQTFENHTLQNTTGNRKVLPPGKYRLFAISNGTEPGNWIKIEYDNVQLENVSIGGIRIKNIISRGLDNYISSIKRFQYVDANGNSTGKMFYKPIFGSKYEFQGGSITGEELTFCSSGGDTDNYTAITLSNMASNPIAMYHGSHVGYTYVEELSITEDQLTNDYISNSELKLGKVAHEFENTIPTNIYVFPYIPLEDLEYKNGNILFKTYINYDVQTLSIDTVYREEFEYTYTADNTSFIQGLSFNKTFRRVCYECNGSDWSYSSYTINPVWKKTTRKRVFQYSDDNKVLTYDTTYNYDGNYKAFSSLASYTEDAAFESYLDRDETFPGIIKGVENHKIINGQNMIINGRRITYDNLLPKEIYSYNSDLGNYEHVSQNYFNADNRLVKKSGYPDKNIKSDQHFKWDGNQHLKIYSVNCADSLFYYSNFEDSSPDIWQSQTSIQINEETTYFSKNQALGMSPAQIITADNLTDGSWALTFITGDSTDIVVKKNGVTLQKETDSYGVWKLHSYNTDISSPLDKIEIINSGVSGHIIDDILLQRDNCSTVKFNYYKDGRMIAQRGDNDQYSIYNYDSFGRLKHIKDFEGNILQKYDYHYQGQPVTQN